MPQKAVAEKKTHVPVNQWGSLRIIISSFKDVCVLVYVHFMMHNGSNLAWVPLHLTSAHIGHWGVHLQ